MSNFNVSKEFRDELFKLAYESNGKKNVDLDFKVISEDAIRLLSSIRMHDTNSFNRYKQQVLNKFLGK
jgi:hypothetical protein